MPLYLTVQQVAERFGMDPKTITRMAKRKTIPATRFGPRGDWRFKIDLLEEWERKSTTGILK